MPKKATHYSMDFRPERLLYEAKKWKKVGDDAVVEGDEEHATYARHEAEQCRRRARELKVDEEFGDKK